RRTMLPKALAARLEKQIEDVRLRHALDRTRGHGAVELPDALARKFPQATYSLGWQWVFRASRTYVHRESRAVRRHHLHETVLQRAVARAAAEAG
ncbi:integrase, partial [Clostridium perfringens]|nr:integrase [Clostridium perfringens]